jgi:hypothetical protein
VKSRIVTGFSRADRCCFRTCSSCAERSDMDRLYG